ncbi:MAG: hypothetical protein ACJASX_001933 [Limisphaerales bacterium]|jgi:hypothetical protein
MLISTMREVFLVDAWFRSINREARFQKGGLPAGRTRD